MGLGFGLTVGTALEWGKGARMHLLEVADARAVCLGLLAALDDLRRELLLAQQQPLELAPALLLDGIERAALPLVAAVALAWAARPVGCIVSWINRLQLALQHLHLVVE